MDFRRGLDNRDGVGYATYSNSFALKLRHGGQLKQREPPFYMGGLVECFENVFVDEWGFITLKDKVEELGYNTLDEMRFFAVGSNGLTELKSDQETFQLVNQVICPKEIEIWVVIGNFGERSKVHVSDVGGPEEVNGRKVDGMFEDLTNPTTENGGVGNSSHVEPKVTTRNILGLASLPLSDDDGSVTGGDGEIEKDLWPSFKDTCDINYPAFCIGLTFNTKNEFKEAVLNYAFKQGKEIKFVKNDKVRCVVQCSHDGCPWMINLRFVKDDMCWRVFGMKDRHNGCSWVYKNKMVNSAIVAKRWKKEIKSHSNWKMLEFREKVCTDENFHLSNRQAFRALAKAKSEIKGEAEDYFNKLWSYCLEIQRTNPGTTCCVKLSDLIEDGRRRFMRIYICWEACKKGFQHCRPIIGVDGCHLKGSTGGQLLTAVGIDGNDNIFPIAYAVVEGENKGSWIWFLELLKRDLGITAISEQEMTFISDKQKGLIPAFEVVLPSVMHRFCVRHLHANMKVAGFQGKLLKDAMWTAARATTVNAFKAAMRNIRNINQNAFDWLSDKHPSEWSRSHFSCAAQCDMLVNNICECYNSMILEARDNPLITCLELLRKQLMTRLYASKKQGAKWTSPICPSIITKIQQNERAAGGYLGYQCDDLLFEIKCMNGDQQVVDLSKNTCSCKKWDLTGIPCKHAISAIWLKNGKGPVFNYVHPCYYTSRYLQTYAYAIKPMAGVDEWPESNRQPPLPPLYKSRPGRPKKLRKRGAGELTKDGVHLSRKHVILHCSKCKKSGHNSRGCTEQSTQANRARVQEVQNAEYNMSSAEQWPGLEALYAQRPTSEGQTSQALIP